MADSFLALPMIKSEQRRIELFKPSCLQISPGRYVFGSIIFDKNRIVLISMYYADIDIDYSQVKVKAFGKDIKLVERRDAVKAESCVILFYEDLEFASLNEVEVTVYYKGLCGKYQLSKTKFSHKEISMVTMVKDDYLLLGPWLAYYCEMGVAHFFIYFNKKVNDQIQAYLEKDLIRYADKMTIFEYNIIYWIIYKRKKIIFPHLVHNKHSAQIFAINDTLVRFGAMVDYLLHFDLDEYLILPKGENLKQLVCSEEYVGNFSYICFKNIWSRMDRPSSDPSASTFINRQPPIDFVEFMVKHRILRNIKSEGLKRTKCLFKTKNIFCMGIHHPRLHDEKQRHIDMNEDRAYFCHIIDLNTHKQKERESLIGDTIPVDRVSEILVNQSAT